MESLYETFDCEKAPSPPYKTFGYEGESSRAWNSSYEDFIREKGWRASGADTKLLAVKTLPRASDTKFSAAKEGGEPIEKKVDIPLKSSCELVS